MLFMKEKNVDRTLARFDWQIITSAENYTNLILEQITKYPHCRRFYSLGQNTNRKLRFFN